MFNKLNAVWTASTPKFLHPYTKQNIIFQITLASVFVGGMWLSDYRQERQIRRERMNNVHDLQEYAGRR